LAGMVNFGNLLELWVSRSKPISRCSYCCYIIFIKFDFNKIN